MMEVIITVLYLICLPYYILFYGLFYLALFVCAYWQQIIIGFIVYAIVAWIYLYLKDSWQSFKSTR